MDVRTADTARTRGLMSNDCCRIRRSPNPVLSRTILGINGQCHQNSTTILIISIRLKHNWENICRRNVNGANLSLLYVTLIALKCVPLNAQLVYVNI